MIIRILGEGQYEVADSIEGQLQELDEQLADAVESGDEPAFRTALLALLDRVRSAGTLHPDSEIDVSEAILPGPDSTVAEVRALLLDDGVIPG
ncbi:MAG: PspA-associated protein PspAA [Actinomycetes bacterium]